MDPQQVSCVNCQAIKRDNGETIWVCERCGTENANASAPTTSPVAADDVSAAAAQADIAAAAAQAGAPLEVSAPPVVQQQTAPPVIIDVPAATMAPVSPVVEPQVQTTPVQTAVPPTTS